MHTHFTCYTFIPLFRLWALLLHFKSVQVYIDQRTLTFLLDTMAESQITKITQLAADGSNWENYRNRIILTIRSKKWKDHLTSDKPTKRYINGGSVNGAIPTERWENNKGMLMHLIVTLIPNSAFNKIKDKKTVMEAWKELKNLYEK
jgi:hypothetical protein